MEKAELSARIFLETRSDLQNGKSLKCFASNDEPELSEPTIIRHKTFLHNDQSLKLQKNNKPNCQHQQLQNTKAIYTMAKVWNSLNFIT